MDSIIVKVCYKNAKKKNNKDEEKNFTTDCNYCKKTLSDKFGNSSNFLKHTHVNYRISKQ